MVLPQRRSVVGSGTGSSSPSRVKAALNMVPPTMSVPIRSQSGSRSPFRIQLCKSGAKGVPSGPTMGLTDDSQKKSPLGNST